MTEVLFINATLNLALNQEGNGTLLLGTKLLQAGFETQILRFAQMKHSCKEYPEFIREMTDKILEIDPKCVSFYTLWPYYHIMLRVASEVKAKRPEIMVVLGGPQASATAEATMKAMPFVDFICTGEGENTVVPFFRALLREDGGDLAAVPGLYRRENGEVVFNSQEMPLCDLNTLPRWDDRLYMEHYSTPEPYLQENNYFMPIDAGRGCPYSCTFCCTSYFWRRMYRLKSPQRIVEDILFYNQKFGIKSFWFSHDAFTSNKKLVSEVCDHILEKGLKIQWRCTARIDCISEELILKMKQAGMTQIELGIETGSKRMQKIINKNLDLQKAEHMIKFLLKNKIHVGLFFMYGLPEETEEDLNQTLELLFNLLDMGVNHVSMSFCRFNPATAITEKYFDQLVLDPGVKALHRGVYGYREEFRMIEENKALFPFLYHLNTPVRDKYHFLFLLVHLYQGFPLFIRHLRKLYGGDNLKFYEDFYNCNRFCFEKDFDYAVKTVGEQSVQMLCNMLDQFDAPYIAQLKELLRFERNFRRVFRSPEDCSIRDTYGFSYIDYKLNLPIEAYSEGKTEILLQRKGGVNDMQVLGIS